MTVAPLVSLWGFGLPSGRGQIPSGEAIREMLPLVDYRRMILNEGTAYLPVKCMAVDLGGIAKGYVVDGAFDLCQEAGVVCFCTPIF